MDIPVLWPNAGIKISFFFTCTTPTVVHTQGEIGAYFITPIFKM